MPKQIKRSNTFPNYSGIDQEFNNLTKQLVHKDDALVKNSVNGTLTFYASSTSGGATNYKITISSTNGQIINLEAV